MTDTDSIILIANASKNSWQDCAARVSSVCLPATLTITLSDYNDNPPVFQPSDQFRVNVSEAESLNSVILRVMATDADRGQQVTYALERSNDDATGVDSFSIIESSGRIYRL